MSVSLKIDYGDGSSKTFRSRRGGSLAQTMGMASASAADLRFRIWPDRGEKRILAMQIDGQGHPAPGRWAISRNGEDWWPTVAAFETEPLEGEVTFTLAREDPPG